MKSSDKHDFNNFLDVAIDSVKTIRSKPLKSSVYGSIGAFLYGCAKTAPDQNDFNEQMKTSEQMVSLVPVESQNPNTVKYLRLLETSQNNETLRITSIGFFSIMWIADFGKDLATFDATCEYLKPELKTFHERIVDVGWWGKWWNLEKQMKDYDLNY